MANAWSLSFKKRMLELRIAWLDIETKEIYLATDYSDIHSDLFSRMNKERFAKGLVPHSIPATMCFDNHPGRGYIRKDTGEFMQANAAADWAASFAEKKTWDGESRRLRRAQNSYKEGPRDYYGNF